jgi:HEAT repeat protein
LADSLDSSVRSGADAGDPASGAAPAQREVTAWVAQLARTLKTCRLYDRNNPTVIRFREGLHQDLTQLLGRWGSLKLETTARALLHEGVPVYTSRSRDDNLPATFHRDGIRSLTLMPGVEAVELDTFLDQILRVTGPGAETDDLVTLLWEQNLSSITIDAVPFEGEVDGAGDEDSETTSTAWPSSDAGSGSSAAPDAEPEPRSDDWRIVESQGDPESAFEWLEAASREESERFTRTYRTELEQPLVSAVIDVMDDALLTARPEDRGELAPFLPRVLREAIALGEWRSARRALAQLWSCDPAWSPASLFVTPESGGSDLLTRKAVAALDHQGDDEVKDFLALAGDLGPDSVDWLMHVLSESQQKRARRPLARTIAMLLKEHPERVLPWMADGRWYVVRNAVHILGWIGGDQVADHLRAVVDHPEMRVRREAVATLSQCTPSVARPILLSMLDAAEPRLFTLILQQLAALEDAGVRQRLVEILRHAHFHQRSEEERRAVYMALAAQGDAVLKDLEDELQRGGLFAQGLDFHRRSLALSLARIGTPGALAVLQRGMKSSHAAVRKACDLALKMGEAPDA